MICAKKRCQECSRHKYLFTLFLMSGQNNHRTFSSTPLNFLEKYFNDVNENRPLKYFIADGHETAIGDHIIFLNSLLYTIKLLITLRIESNILRKDASKGDQLERLTIISVCKRRIMANGNFIFLIYVNIKCVRKKRTYYGEGLPCFTLILHSYHAQLGKY